MPRLHHQGTGMPPPPQGVALIFIPAGGGTPPPWTTSLPPLDPLPPSPLHSNSPENQGFGNVFSFRRFFSSRAFGALIAGFFGHSTVSFLPSVADTMSQRPISAFFSTPIQPCPRVKRDNVVNAILYFRFQDRWTGNKRQEAYNVAQKACSTLFLNTPMATVHEFITQAAVMARQDREVPCLPHEFLLMQPIVCARWAAQMPRTQALLQHAYVLSFTAPTNLHCPAPEVPEKPKKGTPDKPRRERVVAQPASPTTPITVLGVPWDDLLDSVKKVVKVSTGTPLQIFKTQKPKKMI